MNISKGDTDQTLVSPENLVSLFLFILPLLFLLVEQWGKLGMFVVGT